MSYRQDEEGLPYRRSPIVIAIIGILAARCFIPSWFGIVESKRWDSAIIRLRTICVWLISSTEQVISIYDSSIRMGTQSPVEGRQADYCCKGNADAGPRSARQQHNDSPPKRALKDYFVQRLSTHGPVHTRCRGATVRVQGGRLRPI